MNGASITAARAHIPIKPVISCRAFLRREGESIPSVLDAGHTLHMTSGRVAIALALRHAGVGSGHEVLVPAHHCTSMIEPVVWSGATPRFYRIHPDTAVDLADLERKLSQTTRALLVTHYYGFPQDLQPLRGFCDSHGLILIEDCAHAFFGHYRGRPLGSIGDYGIASTMKFFPIYDGGCLVSSRHEIGKIVRRGGGWRFQFKAAINNVENALAYRRLPALRAILQWPLRVKDVAWSRWKSMRGETGSLAGGPSAADGAYEFDPVWVDVAMSLSSRAIVHTASVPYIVQQRRRHYLRLLEAWSNLPGARPLFPSLAADVVPYVFPLLVDEPERVFPLLKNQGVPILRFGEFLWNGVDASVCSVAADYSRRLLQFPCHQELRPAELEWMIERVERALRRLD